MSCSNSDQRKCANCPLEDQGGQHGDRTGLADAGGRGPMSSTRNSNNQPKLLTCSCGLIHSTRYTSLSSVSWEDAVQEACERGKMQYSELAKEARKQGWTTKIYPVEVVRRGFVTSTVRLIRDLDHAIKDISRVAEWSSQWLWKRVTIIYWATNYTTPSIAILKVFSIQINH